MTHVQKFYKRFISLQKIVQDLCFMIFSMSSTGLNLGTALVHCSQTQANFFPPKWNWILLFEWVSNIAFIALFSSFLSFSNFHSHSSISLLLIFSFLKRITISSPPKSLQETKSSEPSNNQKRVRGSCFSDARSSPQPYQEREAFDPTHASAALHGVLLGPATVKTTTKYPPDSLELSQERWGCIERKWRDALRQIWSFQAWERKMKEVREYFPPNASFQHKALLPSVGYWRSKAKSMGSEPHRLNSDTC